MARGMPRNRPAPIAVDGAPGPAAVAMISPAGTNPLIGGELGGSSVDDGAIGVLCNCASAEGGNVDMEGCRECATAPYRATCKPIVEDETIGLLRDVKETGRREGDRMSADNEVVVW
jgi:hypothetical protein